MANVEGLSLTSKFLYLLALIAVLSLCALFVYILCYLTSSESSNTDESPNDARRRRNRSVMKPQVGGNYGWTNEEHLDTSGSSDMSLAVAGKQTMCSALTRSAKDSDVILATAMSSIPLRQLGGKDNDIIVDVSQQMYLNKETESVQEHQCIVCKSRKEIAWDKITCYAQTTIGVVVYKRAVHSGEVTSSSRKIWTNYKEQAGSAHTYLHPDKTSTEAQRSESILTIAPSPDSRLEHVNSS